MSLIKRFARHDQARVSGEVARDSGIPAAAENEVAEKPVEQKAVVTHEPTSPTLAQMPEGGALKRMKGGSERRQAAHRAALDYLNILKALAPVFRAATIYPGHDAAPEQIAQAVRRLSQASVELADFIATSGDTLEVDTAWARKTLHEFSANLVSSFWISSVIAKGGGAEMPVVSAEFFKPAIRAVMALPGDLPKSGDRLNLTTDAAVRLSMLKGLTPIAIEIEKFQSFIGTHVPGAKVSAEDLIGEVGQFLMEQALLHHDRYVADNPDASEDDRRAMLQALVGHSASVVLSAWENCKGEVYAGVSEAKSAQDAIDFMAQAEFTHGFPLLLLKARAEESIRRLVGSASYALTMMRRQGEEPRA